MGSKILVLGAGELGMVMLNALASRKPVTTTLSVLLRPKSISSPDPSKASQISALRALSVSIVPGDISIASIPELSQLFKPYDTIISCLGFASGAGSQVKICRAVLEAGAKRYFPWQFGVDYDVIGRGSAQDLFDEQLDVRDLLPDPNQTATEWVIVSTGMFTSFLFESYFGVVDLSTEPGVDIGKLTAEIVFAEQRIVNEVVFTAGETISYGQLADLVEEVVGKDFGREEWTKEAMQQKLAKDPDDFVQKYRVVFAEGRGVAWSKASTFNGQNGIAVEDVRAWMASNLSLGHSK